MSAKTTPNFYEMLDVGRDATADEIRAAYRAAARRAHPDAGGSAGLFRLIQEAWDVLGDPGRRAVYDQELDSVGTPPPPGGAAHADGRVSWAEAAASRYAATYGTVPADDWSDVDHEDGGAAQKDVVWAIVRGAGTLARWSLYAAPVTGVLLLLGLALLLVAPRLLTWWAVILGGPALGLASAVWWWRVRPGRAGRIYGKPAVYAEQLARRGNVQAAAGAAAEREVAEVLADIRPTVTVHGAFVDADVAGDADHLVLGPIAAVLETKAGGGTIGVADGDLTRDGRQIPGGPHRHVTAVATALTHHLGVPVTPIVVITHMRGGPLLTDAGAIVCATQDLPRVLRRLPRVITTKAARRAGRALLTALR